MIRIAVQMKQAVDDVKGDLVIERLAVFPGIGLGGLGADQNLPVIESDHIGRTCKVHEPAMHVRNDLVRYNHHVHLPQPWQYRFLPGGMF